MEGTFTGVKWDEVEFGEVAGGGKLARASILNRYEGGVDADGALEYLLVYRAGRPVTFSGLERVEAKSGGDGSFVLWHEGTFSSEDGVSGKVVVIDGMGTGRFASFTATGTISSRPGEHHGTYVLVPQGK
ncbi:MAG TPA: DUF3224 domain-containing protein [Devosia sp.]|jgi:hypothetical protein|uniref:DUF3224 domain-containing protein n=1 Tax=Devosia sp. TaxID=1871048 RepID=UPI002DDCBA79|nr:DUF3224 domain-containing protein [Devosia sp.]HEV2515300.1 DUF3224 domain-containing protein [Devosia sp.]